MSLENRQQHLIQPLAAKIERTKVHIAVDRDNLQGRARGGEIPARVSPGKLIAGGKVGAAARVQILQKMLQPPFEVDLGNHAGNGDTASSGISEFGHG